MNTSDTERVTRRSKNFLIYPRARTALDNQPGPPCAIWIPAHQIGVPIPPRIEHKFRVLVSKYLPPVRVILSTEVFQAQDIRVTASFVGARLPDPPLLAGEMLREPQVRTTRSDGFRGDFALALW